MSDEHQPITATISRSHGFGPFKWHAMYRVGIGIAEAGSHAWTRRGIERKAHRVMAKLRRQHDQLAYIFRLPQ